MHLSVKTRPDITYAVNCVARFSFKPTQQHWNAVTHIMRYPKGTTNHGILYSKNNACNISGYSDANWAGDINDRKSTSGYAFFMSGGAITWKSQKQWGVGLSAAEVEYMALSAATQEAVWLRQLPI